jgi:glycosyltransferase involved in cell wall biosynthesis
MKDRAGPMVSVVICTRNRRDNPVKTLASVLKCSAANIEVLLMDQSDGDETCSAVLPLLATNSNLRYFLLSVPGKPFALNAALEQARGGFLLLTDDDCEPQGGWVEAMVAPFANPEVACVFGAVDPAPHDPYAGYITSHAVRRSFSVKKLAKARGQQGRVSATGMGANLALRKSCLDAIGGWDTCIGPGSKFRGGDDHDIAMRLSLRGNHTAFSAEGRVTHHGFRRWSERYNDPMRYGYGLGAATAKYLRCGILHVNALAMLSYHVREGIGHPTRGIRSSPCWAFVRYYYVGFREGLRHPLDRATWRFSPVEACESVQYGNHFANVVLRSELDAGREWERK